jgi:hypothetical protein
MKRNLFAIGLLALSVSALAQITANPKVLTHVDKGGVMFVSKGTLYYNGGGMQTKDTGNLENHGNVMLVASDVSNDVFRTLDASGTDRVYASGSGYNAGGIFVNSINEPTGFADANTINDGDKYTYGQLYIQGIAQNNITGVVYQEHANVNHGTYQQVALPFFDKEINSLSASTEIGKTFSNVRWSMDEILKYNNTNVVFDPANLSTKTSDRTGYYILGNKNNTVSFGTTKTIVGRPYANNSSSVTLQDAGKIGVINFGTGGNAINAYNEKYNTYVQDGFESQAGIGGSSWAGNFGRNIYQFGNPYLTNLDLKELFVGSSAIPNIYGIRVEQANGTVSFSPNVGGGAGTFRYITYSGTTLVGDSDWAIVRPMSVFSIKLKNNNSGSSINFDNLRRFGYVPRTATSYDVTAARAALNPGTTKELAVVALDQNGTEIGRSYYVVTPNAQTGHSANATMQVAASSTNVIGTYEEDAINGGYDNNYTSSYWLYINEANENFQGKAIPMVIYNPLVKSVKFLVKEEGVYIPNGSSLLSTGISFYQKLKNGTVQQVVSGQIIPVNIPTGGTDNDLYYGMPTSSLGTDNIVKTPSRTTVAYNEAIDNYTVIFDPNWKTADIKVYDFSGKVVLSKNKVSASKDFVIELARNNKAFVVSVTSEKGEVVNAKIIR